ncbi:trypsin-like serine protease [Streptomyces sp. NBC_00663]|uniref:trypsin-like serine protease n=1 Tax=Streptomyces sp. NBC_00663 TaxID=2975801 RepID=UPI002E3216D0|nr:trypsin-like serine protease [Streptomyces sp. NBC_00663]
MRIGLPVAAAGVAAAVAAALMTTSAGAATALPEPTAKPAVSAVSQAELTKRVAGAVAGDDTAGETTSKSSLSASTSSGTVDPKIIGGSTTTISSAPWMAQLWYYDDKGTTDTSDDLGFFCGGSVVSPTKILTAAHCVKGYNWAKNGAIVTGTTSLPDENGNTTGEVTGVVRQWNHPSYSSTTIDNDIAVITLGWPVKATPIKMTTSTETAAYTAGTSAKVYGWGRTSSTTQDISDTLKVATLPVQSDTTCAGYYGTDFIKGHMVCAGNPATGSDSGTTSACNGDSGGPLVVNGRIVGVVSWGVTDCVEKGAYSVFSKVKTYIGAAYAQVDDANMSYTDAKADLFVRNASTKTAYEKDSKGTSFGARQSLGNFGAVNLVLQTDLNRDSVQDFVYRVASTGDVYWLHYVFPADPADDGTWAEKQIFDNWKTRTRIVTPGDLTGDYLPDVVSVDSAGKAWLYPGKGNGSFSARVQIGTGTGWNQYNTLRGKGDFNGDGKADLIARNKSTGAIYLYKGTGKASAPFSARVKVRTWSNTTYNAFDAIGDVTGDGKADFLARTPGGTLYLYKGTGKATSEIFATRISVGTDFKQYDIFG